MLAVQFPSWANSENLQWILLGIVGAMLVLMVMVARFVQKIVTKVVLLMLFGGVGLLAWVDRADLKDCATTCECRVLHIDVKVPTDKNPVCSLKK